MLRISISAAERRSELSRGRSPRSSATRVGEAAERRRRDTVDITSPLRGFIRFLPCFPRVCTRGYTPLPLHGRPKRNIKRRSPGFTNPFTAVALNGRHSSSALVLRWANWNHALSGLLAYVVPIPRAAPWAMESRRFAATTAFGRLSIFPSSRAISKAGAKLFLTLIARRSSPSGPTPQALCHRLRRDGPDGRAAPGRPEDEHRRCSGRLELRRSPMRIR
jgi:hypothetical protein